MRMSSIQGKVKQYYLLINSLQRRPNQTSGELMQMLYNEGFSFSSRTFLRIFESLRDDFGIEIECNRSANTYSINEKLSKNIDIFMYFLHTSLQVNFVVENIKDAKSMAEYIHFSNIYAQKGIELLQPIYNSIKEYKIIEFEHINYIASTSKHYQVEPYLLKEYLNRWYVFGYVQEYQAYRTFGLDRMINMQVLDKEFKRDKSIKPAEYFENTVGLTYDKHELQEVMIQANDIEVKYLRSQPLHSSQVELNDNRFKLILTPNYELLQLILMRGCGLWVLEPEWLKIQVKNELMESLECYK